MKKIILFLSLILSGIYLVNFIGAITITKNSGEVLDNTTWGNISSLTNKIDVTGANIKLNGKLYVTGKICDNSGKCLGIKEGTEENPGLSCKTILADDNTAGDGIYWIDPNGGDIADKFQVYCDMTTDSGGWTLVGKMATNSGNIWGYDKNIWTDDTLLNENNINLNNQNYKNKAWGTLVFNDFRAQLIGGSDFMTANWATAKTFKDIFINSIQPTSGVNNATNWYGVNNKMSPSIPAIVKVNAINVYSEGRNVYKVRLGNGGNGAVYCGHSMGVKGIGGYGLRQPGCGITDEGEQSYIGGGVLMWIK
ncbi:MAG: fibrinogen-like YCDxxxxGGGW domain-containing protein [Candidatus Gracilibacteria bacterium]|nr:fibrinogen-like YCDxxxxGGGW domain-containing protein [Candidatus Gracilibacteria bacterium]